MLSSVVGRAIEPTCLAVVHKAQTAVAAISGHRCARWHVFSQRRVRGAWLRSNFFNHIFMDMYILVTTRATSVEFPAPLAKGRRNLR